MPSRYKKMPTPCWIWQGPFKGNGYTDLYFEGKQYLVHRLVLFFKNGTWPIDTDHICLDKTCINEDHLEDVSHSENMKRMHQAKRETANGSSVTEAVAGSLS